MAPIPFATIGTSWITASFITSAHSTSQWQLRAIYSRKAETAKHFAAKHTAYTEENNANIAIHDSLDALAKDKDVQVVYIASPNSLHFAHAKQMLEAGKHVVVEKPAANNLKELDQLFKVAKENNVFLLEAFRHLHEKNFIALKSSLPKIGKILGANLSYCQYSSKIGALEKGEKPNVFDLNFGGGCLVDLGVYCVSAAVELLGAPERVEYHPTKVSTGADGAGVLLLHYHPKDSEAFTVTITASKLFNSSSPSEVFGSTGTLSIPTITDIEKVTYWDAKSKEKESFGGEREHLNLREEALEFARIIGKKDQEAVRSKEEVSRAVIEVTESARRGAGLLFKGES
ncbi:NAD(P)-binding protein [Delitschia confertaspora ATCC 74209]|uniref:NAD(P)-binding protein n=1 Tax=Delitschia confertaspora ATCC 74209 TaxID=1513339 RepID=A0A9P4JLN5_9PLEO|nr:NAD(P)-binding protein [Delitschia confertaspora ATCC 74209]